MSEESGGVINVEILGQRYPIRSGLDASYVTELAGYVDQKMQTAAERSQAGDSVRVAVLAALNIADEYFDAGTPAPRRRMTSAGARSRSRRSSTARLRASSSFTSVAGTARDRRKRRLPPVRLRSKIGSENGNGTYLGPLPTATRGRLVAATWFRVPCIARDGSEARLSQRYTEESCDASAVCTPPSEEALKAKLT